MSCSCQKIAKLIEGGPMSMDTFLCVNKRKILENKNLMSALFNQYKNYLYKSARKVANRYPGIELDELISEGFEGILRALEKYDCNESSFLTYAQHWVRMKMFSAARRSIGLMSLPGSLYGVITKVKKALDSDPELTYVELAEITDTSQEKVAIVLDIIRSPKCGGVSSLEEFITYEDTFYRGVSSVIEESIATSDFQDRFWAILDEEVSRKEKFVLELLFGRNGDMRRSLEWVAKVLHVSKERIRQIKEAAFTKLRESEDLIDLMEAEELVDFED